MRQMAQCDAERRAGLAVRGLSADLRRHSRGHAEHSSVTRSFFRPFAWMCLPIAFIAGCSPAPPPQPPVVVTTSLDAPQARLIEQRRTAVVAAPDSAEAWGALGQAFDAVDFDAEAAFCYRRAVTLDRDAAKWFHLLGLATVKSAPEEAIGSLRRAADLQGPETDISRVRLMQALLERGRHEDAVGEIQRLLAIDPNHAAARLELGRVRLMRNSLEEAAAALAPCLTNRYTAQPALLLLAQVRQRQGNSTEAASLAEQAGNMPRPFDWPDPFLKEVLRLRADRGALQDRVNQLLIAGRMQEAEAALGQLLTTYRQDPDGLLLLGRMRVQQRRCAEAEAALRAHLRITPESLNGLVQLALALLCQERWADGGAVLRQVTTIKPDFAQAHYNLGYALSRAGDPAGAIAAYTDAVRCNPGDVGSHVALAEELFRAGRDGEAEQQLETALTLEPDDSKALQLRARHPKP